MQPGPRDSTPTNQARRIAGLTDYETLGFGSAVKPHRRRHRRPRRSCHGNPQHHDDRPTCQSPRACIPQPAGREHGRTTGLTFGTVVDISFDGIVTVDGRPAYFEDQIAIVGTHRFFSKGGDSGSLILDNPGSHPVGLLFAGDNTHTLANPIQAVLNRFGATIVTA